MHILPLIPFILLPLNTTPKKALTAQDLVHVKKVSMPAVTPDGKTLFYVSTKYCLRSNKGKSWIYKTSARKAASSTRIHPRTMTALFPSVSPNGKLLAFIGIDKNGPQVWIKDLKADSPPTPLTTKRSLPYGAMGPLVWAPDSGSVLFNAAVPPKCTTHACLKKCKAKQRNTSGWLFDKLMYRHWNQWRKGLVNKLFQLNITSKKIAFITTSHHDTPPVALGGHVDFAFSPDGKEIAYVKNTAKQVAKSTNNDVWIYNVKSGHHTQLTTGTGNDHSPHYSPDGRYLAYQSMKHAGYEADKADIMLYDRKTKRVRNLTAKLDINPSLYLFAPDRKRIYFTGQEKGHLNMWSVDYRGRIKREFVDQFITNFKVLNGGKMVLETQSISSPRELYFQNGTYVRKGALGRVRSNRLVPLSDKNSLLLQNIQMGKAHAIWVKGDRGDMIHALVLKPPFFKKGKRYPVVFLIHGGPQGAFGYDFHPRWNSQLFAAPGYVVVMPNFHGSTGYGMKFQNAIRGNWGGSPYKDVMAVFDAVQKLPYVQKEKIGAAGASYGGYLIDWIGTKNNRFKCLITHSGVYNLSSMYGSTEELWFPEWENHGTPWENRELYRKYSPHNYVQNWKTPTLIVHGALDFRVTVDQSMQLFTSLQRLGVPSKFLYFPDEDHFVFKPKNRIYWWKTVHHWLKTYLK